jgi:hypothetical protein
LQTTLREKSEKEIKDKGNVKSVKIRVKTRTKEGKECNNYKR